MGSDSAPWGTEPYASRICGRLEKAVSREETGAEVQREPKVRSCVVTDSEVKRAAA